ncbi:MAG: tRNA 2-thiouridine(34) synthase MnmA [Candidatus Pacebacteria bacterium]|nr:tRNA 2-thiouridine(34) synthase MnmA [Candidatus Paceibacterota bacterium]
MNKQKTVFVGVSGGVDSSVSAALLKDQGYNVVGVFIRTWQPDFIECTWRDERRDAMRVCAHLDIPFLECDGEEAYKNGVADYMISEYKLGRTPNPDVMCNREVKFGVFWNFAKSHGADFIATGHYAQNINNKLVKGNDESKDQSYFLWTLNSDDLEHTLFPIGHLPKTEVRKLAEKYKLPTAVKKDSQGVCFLGPLDMKDFLSHYIEPKKGDVLNEDGDIIGHHDGAVFFTLGERHGFHITEKGTTDTPYYVISKDIDKNTIYVSPRPGLGLEEEGSNTEYVLNNSNILKENIDQTKKYTAQIRYHGEFLNCSVMFDDVNPKITFDNPILVSPGQSIVVYDRDICLGGGIVK